MQPGLLHNLWQGGPFGDNINVALLCFALIGFFSTLALSFIENRYREKPATRGILNFFVAMTVISLGLSVGELLREERTEHFAQVGANPTILKNGLRVRLIDVRSPRGWNERVISTSGASSMIGIGDHSGNADIPITIWSEILSNIQTNIRPSDVKSMNQNQFEEFLLSLTPNERKLLSRWSWAHILVLDPDSGNRAEFKFATRDKQLVLSLGEENGTMIIKNIFNVPDVSGFENEAVLFEFRS